MILAGNWYDRKAKNLSKITNKDYGNLLKRNIFEPDTPLQNQNSEKYKRKGEKAVLQTISKAPSMDDVEQVKEFTF